MSRSSTFLYGGVASGEGRAPPRSAVGDLRDGTIKRMVGFRPSPFLLLVVVVAASLLLPGVAHLRLGAAVNGLVFLLLTAVLSAIQFAAPFVERPSIAVVSSGSAFAVGWLVSLVAARSAARLVHA